MGRCAEAAAGGRRVGRSRPANFRIDRLRQLPHHSRYRGQRRFGPDLPHLMTRVTIGAGVAMNTRDHLRVWVDDPNVMKPGALMPAMNLGDKDLDDLVAYLATLH